jgi:hypothetical protein
MDLVLDPGPLPNQMRAAGNLPTQRTGPIIRSHTGGKKSAASSWARIRASTLSVLTFASAIARVLDGFDTTTRPTIGVNRFAIASLLPVASNAT